MPLVTRPPLKLERGLVLCVIRYIPTVTPLKLGRGLALSEIKSKYGTYSNPATPNWEEGWRCLR